MMNVKLSKEVSEAISEGKPVVALESTIISHGMPYPKNVVTVLECEETARNNGAVPATCAIIGGELCAGLTRDEIEYLGKAGTRVTKVSRRDIPIIAARKLDGATTVAGTMIIAAAAGISVFATGGIGGVHRGAEKTMDISADLEELARTNVAVVCSGAKSILDIGLTLEYLETKGVPVISYGTEEFPAFYTRSSGFMAPYMSSSAEEIARIIAARSRIGLDGGMVIGNPVPEEYEMDGETIDRAINEALREADASGINGKAITPFLLDRIQRLTGGESLETNIRLVKNNVELAAKIAVSLASAC